MAQHEELMKKTETMNVLIGTNKMLREEKEKLEQNLQQLQAKVGIGPHFHYSDIIFNLLPTSHCPYTAVGWHDGAHRCRCTPGDFYFT